MGMARMPPIAPDFIKRKILKRKKTFPKIWNRARNVRDVLVNRKFVREILLKWKTGLLGKAAPWLRTVWSKATSWLWGRKGASDRAGLFSGLFRRRAGLAAIPGQHSPARRGDL
jgi:hypothetical protein